MRLRSTDAGSFFLTPERDLLETVERVRREEASSWIVT
jgi:hypothetical protein